MFELEKISITQEKTTLKIKIRGEIDHHLAKRYREKIDNEIYSRKPSMILLDLSLIEFMDSSGLGLIMGRYANSKEIGANFLIYKPCKKVKKILCSALATVMAAGAIGLIEKYYQNKFLEEM